ncbi:YfiM family lipoprotein [Enterobacter sp. C4G1]|uniref:YfiM family lipoprotein n=1 Tax=Enterobacter sp. C4G1 TaxID=3458724 RepID=UPI0040699161
MELIVRIPLLLTILCLTGCSHMANDNWYGQDKAQHFLASAMLSAAGNEYAQHQGYSQDRSAAIGFMFSVSLGASKELWDSRPAGSGWSWKDLAWDVTGATTGYAVWQMAHY